MLMVARLLESALLDCGHWFFVDEVDWCGGQQERRDGRDVGGIQVISPFMRSNVK